MKALQLLARKLLPLILLGTAAAPSLAQTGKPTDDPPPPPPAAEYSPAAWKEFFSAEGRFSVLLPGTPTKTIQATETPVGKIELYNFTLRTFAQYDVMYIDSPVPLEGESREKPYLDAVRDQGMQAVKGQLLEEQVISVEGHPGRFLRVGVGDGHVMRIKYFVVGSRLYQLIITMRERDAPPGIAKFHDETAAKFLDSFKLNDGRVVSSPTAPAAAAEQGAGAATEGEVDRLLKSLPADSIVAGQCANVYCKKISGAVVEFEVTSNPAPPYPPIARAARASGTVVVKLVFDEGGKVLAAQAESGHPLLQAAAVKAARGVQITPVVVKGKPAKVLGVISYNFVLN